MSIASPSSLRGSFTPAGDIESTLTAPARSWAASSGATAPAVPSRPRWHLLVNPSPKERPMMTPAAAAASLTMPPAPAGRQLPSAGSVLVVTARPGQESADLGGLLYAFRRSGARLALLCLTRGEASPLNSTWCARLEAVRPWEVQLAANVLGISEVTVASCPDGGLRSHPVADLTQLVRHAIGQYCADLLLVSVPEAGDPDDAAVARAACAAARQAGVPVVARAGPGATGAWMIDLGADAAIARAIQKSAAVAHQSQSQALPELIRRLDRQDGRESLRWLEPPNAAAEHDKTIPGCGGSA
jgi:N-acetylglucosamine malate deacetylase 2